MKTGWRRRARAALLSIGALVSACAVAPTPSPTIGQLEPPVIEFVGLVNDGRVFDDRFEFTDASGAVHSITGADLYRQLNEHGCCGPLLVLGHDAEGAFMVSFPTQGGLPEDCYVENGAGIDRGSHIEIRGVLWRKAPGLEGSARFGSSYPAGTRFCFDDAARITSIVPL
jgi:hypothetical protein